MLQQLAANVSSVLIQKEVAQRLGVSRRTMTNWARQGYGPRPTRIGNTVVYDRFAVEAFKMGAR